ncbi:MAG: hypothetical protein Q4G66_13070 [bacterium]|nr:hypothetical protein [bacterium]
MADLPPDAQIDILGSLIGRMSMRLLRAGLDPETVLTQPGPSPDERTQMQATANYLVGQVALDYLKSDVEGRA